jgi:hypothetical protein
LRELVAGFIPAYTARQMTYDLRRLRRKGFIRRAHRQPTLRATDRRPADRRLLHEDPVLAELDPTLPHEIAERSPLARAWRALQQALEARLAAAQLTA